MSSKNSYAIPLLLGAGTGAFLGKGAKDLGEPIRRRLLRKSHQAGRDTPRGKELREALEEKAPEGVKVLDDEATVDYWKDYYNLHSPSIAKAIAMRKGSFYSPDDKVIGGVENKSVAHLARELGRAEMHKRLGKRYRRLTSMADSAAKLSPLAAGAGLALHFAHPNRSSKSAKAVRNASMAMAAVPLAMRWATESAASRIGRKKLREIGYDDPRTKKEMRLHTASQMATAATPALLAGGIYGVDALSNSKKVKELIQRHRRLLRR